MRTGKSKIVIDAAQFLFEAVLLSLELGMHIIDHASDLLARGMIGQHFVVCRRHSGLE